MITPHRVLTRDNAWRKGYDYRGHRNEADRHYVYNHLTEERRPITEQQYNYNGYTLERARQNIV